MRILHVVSHTHWDREWYRPFQLFRLKLVHLIDGLLDLLEKDPQFRYFMLDGQTIVLEDYLAIRPEKEAILRQHIQKGRILIGPWHILPDMFLVGPEAHIRNLLLGDHTARKFGPKMKVGYIPDPFGHPGQVPQILQGFDIETACLWRGLDEEPAEFWWQSPDGSRVLMVYLRDSYSNGASLPADNLPLFANGIAAAADALIAHSGVQDHLILYGTDHMEPPPNTSKAIAYADRNLPDFHVIHSTLPNYVDAIQACISKHRLTLPEVAGELRNCRRMHLLPGVLSTRIWIKQRNHASENLLLKWVEPFSAFAGLLKTDRKSPSAIDRPSSIVHKTWRLLMENHPHDSICGCSIDQVHAEMKVRFDQVDQIGEELVQQSLETLAANIQTNSGLGRSAIVVFNPVSNLRTDVVNAAIELSANVCEFDLVDGTGAMVPYQTGGFGSREIINVTLDVKGFQSAFGSINSGRAAGMTVQDLKIHRKEDEVFIEAIMADGGEPNLSVWKAGRKQVDEYLADPAVTTYHVRARSASSTQIIFTARALPGNGYQTLWVRPRSGKGKAITHLNPLIKALLPLARLPFIQSFAARKRYAKPPYRIENDSFEVQVDQKGTLVLLDKRTNVTYRGLNCFKDGGDCGDEYNFAPPIVDRVITPRLKHVCLFRGPVQESLELEMELRAPCKLSPDRKSRSSRMVTLPITTHVSLTTGVPRVDIHTKINNSARDHRLRVHFPAPFSVETGYQDGHFEVVGRKLGVPAFDGTWIEQPRPEAPQRAFTDISDGKFGLMVANRGLPEVEVLKNPPGNAEIALTLLRCVGWLSRDDFATRKGHAGPFMETPEAQMPGEWTFDYSIIPHSGDWQNTFEQAYAFETPPRLVSTGLHGGTLPPAMSFVETNSATFAISTIKPGEDGRGWLVRGYNLTGEEINVTLKPWMLFKKAELVNLAEEKQALLKPDKNGHVSFNARGHEIVSIMFKN